MLEPKQIKNTFLLLTVTIFTLLSWIGCNERLTEEKNSATKASTNLVELTEITDTIQFNQYKYGKKEGIWKMFHANGQLKEESTYKAGLKEGLHREWANNGILFVEGFYVNGKANGLMKWFHEKGHLAGSGNMINGIREGKWAICDIEENGFCIEAYFRNGKRDGIWKINHVSGDKLWKEQTWKEDKIVSEKCWDEDGKVIECKERIFSREIANPIKFISNITIDIL